jgi:hypothetical protein
MEPKEETMMPVVGLDEEISNDIMVYTSDKQSFKITKQLAMRIPFFEAILTSDKTTKEIVLDYTPETFNIKESFPTFGSDTFKIVLKFLELNPEKMPAAPPIPLPFRLTLESWMSEANAEYIKNLRFGDLWLVSGVLDFLGLHEILQLVASAIALAMMCNYYNVEDFFPKIVETKKHKEEIINEYGVKETITVQTPVITDKEESRSRALMTNFDKLVKDVTVRPYPIDWPIEKL